MPGLAISIQSRMLKARRRPHLIACTLVEDYGLVAIAEDAVLEVPADGAGKDDALKVASAGDEIFDLVAMRDAGDILLDDGPVVEHGGDVMAGGADELDSASVGRVIGASTDERGQKGVVHIDDLCREVRDKRVSQDLHVARENDEFDVQGLKEGQLLRFGFDAGGRSYRDVFEANAVVGGELLDLAMVGDDDCDFAGQLAGAGAMEQVGDAMQVLRAEERDARALAGEVQLPAHLELLGKRRKGVRKSCDAILGLRCRRAAGDL